ncbi:MAG: tyrosine-protein phosphatase [Oscillospiraceae bacterium]|jgi:protein-tyrosine phosphatase|nr:tyrosine-protein phosphatase [Oscillospiraceae bacterium]
MKNFYRRLPLETLHNARDLGGHPVPGGVTRFGAFVRCEAPCALSPSDIDFLRDYGVTTSIDFRGDGEISRQPSSFEHCAGIAYVRSPTFNDQVAFGAKPGSKSPPVTAFVKWGEKYVEMADTCHEWICETLEALADVRGCALYNCTTGKDRTGIMSALLLGLAGASFEDIIADYCVSEVYLQSVYIPLLEAYNSRFPEEGRATVSDPFFRTEPSAMAELLGHLQSEYGGIPEYARVCGVRDGTVQKIREKLL